MQSGSRRHLRCSRLGAALRRVRFGSHLLLLVNSGGVFLHSTTASRAGEVAGGFRGHIGVVSPSEGFIPPSFLPQKEAACSDACPGCSCLGFWDAKSEVTRGAPGGQGSLQPRQPLIWAFSTRTQPVPPSSEVRWVQGPPTLPSGGARGGTHEKTQRLVAM